MDVEIFDSGISSMENNWIPGVKNTHRKKQELVRMKESVKTDSNRTFFTQAFKF